MILHHLFEGLWHNEAPFVCPQVASWAARLSPRLDGRACYRLAVMFQVLLVGSSLWRGRCACVISKGWLLFFWTSEGGDNLFSLSCRDTHHIAGGCFGLAFRLSACDSHPLLALNNIRMDPHCLSSRSRNMNKIFLLLVMRTYWSLLVPLSVWKPLHLYWREILTELNRWHGCHVCSYLHLFWTEFKHLRVNQSLKNIFEDVAILGKVSQHPMI